MRSAIAVVFLLFAVTLVAPFAGALQPTKTVTIGFIPGETPETLKENGQAIAKMIEAKIGLPVNIYVGKNYGELIDAMKNKKVDFAFLSAMSYVFAERTAGAKVLLKKVWDGPYYYATILSRGDQKLTKLQQLKGKSFAFVDEKSASGYLYPQAYFKKNGIDAKTFFKSTIFSGNHNESIKLLRDGGVDAVAVFANDPKAKDTAWEHTPAPDKKKYPNPHRVWISDPIPNDPFCVRQEFYDANPKISHDLMFALIELDEDAATGPTFKKLLGVSSLMLATSQQYDPVRDLVKSLDLKLDAH